MLCFNVFFFFFFQAEDGIRDKLVTGVQTCALPIWELQASGIEFPHLPEISPCKKQHRPNDEDKERNENQHRSEEHTSELQSLAYLVCRLLLEKKKKKKKKKHKRKSRKEAKHYP